MNVLNQSITNDYAIYHGDSVEVVRNIPTDSLHYTLFSPPFASLFTYSNSDRDMGNCSGDGQFMQHFKFLIAEMFRATMPGRLLSFHCMNLPTSKTNHGYIGIRDFRGELIRLFLEAGFIYHSEVCIWKDPVVAQRRTKALGLLHKQMVKDSCMSRQGIPDFIVTMRKPGVNPERVSGCFDVYYGEGDEPDRGKYTTDTDPRNWYSIEVWQRYASPVWMDIKQSRTLQYRSARAADDERHICPLQLDVISRCLELWTNPGDVVLDPFGGIMSTGHEAIKMGRKAIMIELKESYYRQGEGNMVNAVAERDKELDDMLG